MQAISRHPINRLLAIAFVAMALATACVSNDSLTKLERLADFDKSRAVIETRSGEQHSFTVYLAISSAQRKQGLSFITNLGPEEGMLFIFPKSQRIGMWMKNTPTSLDMLFVNRHGTILKIVRNTNPNSTESIRSDANAYAVLELNAGTARRLSINVGDKLLHERLSHR